MSAAAEDSEKVPKKRGRPRKIQAEENDSNKKAKVTESASVSRRESTRRPVKKPQPEKKSPELEAKPPPKKRGRKPKSETQSAAAKQQPVPKKSTKDDYVYDEDDDDDDEEESEQNEENSSDEEFKLEESEASPEEEDDEEDDEEENEQVEEEVNDNSHSDNDNNPKNKKSSAKKKYFTRRSLNKSDNLIKQLEHPPIPELDHYDPEVKITEWTYELDPETKAFTRPKIPNLSDDAIQPFLSSKSNPPKLIIYECPFCKKIFTYPLVFKTHLYSCPMNQNVPEYTLFCSKAGQCAFKSNRKQDMLNHYAERHATFSKFVKKKDHTNESAKSKLADESVETEDEDDGEDEDLIDDEEDDDDDDGKFKLSKTKKNQLKISQYYFINANEFRYSLDMNEFKSNSIRNIPLIDKIYRESPFTHHIIDTSSLVDQESNNLKFDLGQATIRLKPFEMHQHITEFDSVRLINLVNHVNSIDWCPTKLTSKSSEEQYLACAQLPLESLLAQLPIDPNERRSWSEFNIQDLFQAPNLIYILKFGKLKTGAEFKLFGLLNRKIGLINCVQWRPDFGASQSILNTDFIGYLLAASSNGYAYIYAVEDMTRSADFQHEQTKLNIYEPANKRHVILKPSFSYGQCTSADWSSMNGSRKIAVGYADGLIGVYVLNKSMLEFYANQQQPDSDWLIYPCLTLNGHQTFVKTVEWSKLDGCMLASGSLFSREIKVWNLSSSNTDKAQLDYEVYVTDTAFSLHSNDLFLTKENNLKGDNRILALDLCFSLFNKDRDESRAHSSIFYTYSSLSSISQSDYLNKLLVCDNDGSVIISRANDTKFWIQKHKLLNYSFARVAKFSVINDKENTANESTTQQAVKQSDKKQSLFFERDYDINTIQNRKSESVISINLDRKQNIKPTAPPTNPIWSDVNSLTKIKWNPNIGFHNWYACASMSGFVFIQKLNEFQSSLDSLV